MPKAKSKRSGLTDTWGRRNRKLLDRECPECGTTFRPKGATSVYCSRTCQWKNNAGPKTGPRRTIEQHVRRFWGKVAKSEGCWVWMGEVSSGGYGIFRMNDQHVAAHRFAYTLMTGDIPSDKELDHLCRNTICVRTEHLEAVTHTQNIIRGYKARGTRK